MKIKKEYRKWKLSEKVKNKNKKIENDGKIMDLREYLL